VVIIATLPAEQMRTRQLINICFDGWCFGVPFTSTSHVLGGLGLQSNVSTEPSILKTLQKPTIEFHLQKSGKLMTLKSRLSILIHVLFYRFLACGPFRSSPGITRVLRSRTLDLWYSKLTITLTMGIGSFRRLLLLQAKTPPSLLRHSLCLLLVRHEFSTSKTRQIPTIDSSTSLIAPTLLKVWTALP
jgi:hypothetical protein